MNERQRMQYLEAMGIESYVPRFVLRVAKPPTQCELPSQVKISGGERSAVQVVSSTNAPLRVSEILEKTDTEIRPSTSTPSFSENDEVAIEDVTRTIDEVVEPPAKFSLALWRASETLLVIDSRQHGDALPTHSLLGNILQLLGAMPLALPKEEILNWPLVENGTDSSWSAATQMVKGFLEGRLLDSPVEQLMLFGEDAVKAVLGEQVDYDEARYQSVAVEQFDAQATLLPSLADVLRTPSLKRDVWLALAKFAP